MNNMKIRSGERLDFPVYQADPESISATFIAQFENTIITDTEVYEDGVAWFSFDSPETDVVGTYDVQVNENFAVGSPDIYPSADDCDGDCDFLTLEICPSLPEGS